MCKNKQLVQLLLTIWLKTNLTQVLNQGIMQLIKSHLNMNSLMQSNNKKN